MVDMDDKPSECEHKLEFGTCCSQCGTALVGGKKADETPCLSDMWIANFLRRFKSGRYDASEARNELIKVTDNLVNEAIKQALKQKGEMK